MFKKILLGVLAVLVVFLVLVAMRPADFEVSRTAIVNAPAAFAFAQVNDFKAWADWSPWDKLDPAIKRTYGDISAGQGATYHWLGNDQVGEGKMTITDAQAPNHVGIDLEFIKPFPSKNRTEFNFATSGSGTSVTWSMKGRHDFMGKLFGLFMNMDKMIGGDFEKGLGDIKRLAEAAATKQAEEAAAAAAAAQAAPADEAALDAGTP